LNVKLTLPSVQLACARFNTQFTAEMYKAYGIADQDAIKKQAAAQKQAATASTALTAAGKAVTGGAATGNRGDDCEGQAAQEASNKASDKPREAQGKVATDATDL